MNYIYSYCNLNFIPDNILSNFITRSKNHGNCSSCRMTFVRNEIVTFFKINYVLLEKLVFNII
jgi:hypothetical protein